MPVLNDEMCILKNRDFSQHKRLLEIEELMDKVLDIEDEIINNIVQ